MDEAKCCRTCRWHTYFTYFVWKTELCAHKEGEEYFDALEDDECCPYWEAVK